MLEEGERKKWFSALVRISKKKHHLSVHRFTEYFLVSHSSVKSTVKNTFSSDRKKKRKISLSWSVISLEGKINFSSSQFNYLLREHVDCSTIIKHIHLSNCVTDNENYEFQILEDDSKEIFLPSRHSLLLHLQRNSDQNRCCFFACHQVHELIFSEKQRITRKCYREIDICWLINFGSWKWSFRQREKMARVLFFHLSQINYSNRL